MTLLTDPADVVGIFESIINDDIIALITIETNKYAAKCLTGGGNLLKKRSRSHEWKDVTKEEIRLYLGILILMGIIDKPSLQSYFSRHPLLNTPIFYEIMKRDRFLLILKFLHFSDSVDSTNKMYKIEKLLQLFKESFRKVYIPSRDISIDESLLLWKGRLSWRMYIPLKRARYGIEAFLMCEAKSGYVFNFIIYTGKGTKFTINLPDVAPSNQSHSSNIVLSLMEGLYDQGYFLGIDNYYSSVFLFDYLASHKTDVIGTVRKNRRDLPKEVTSANLKKGQTKVMFRKKLMLLKWKDKKDVLIMSTIHDDKMETIKIRGGAEKQKPVACIEYKDNMTGVDIMDQCLSTNNVARNHIKKY